MRFAILGSVALPIPPPFQGGTEWIAYYQAKILSQRGHTITLLGAEGTSQSFKDSKVKVLEIGKGDVVAGSKKEAVFDPTLTESSRKLRLEMVYLSQVCQKLIELKDDYDLILNNMRGEAVFLPVAKLLNKKFVNVMHLNLFEELAKLLDEYQTNIITISNAQRNYYPNLNYLATVYNGVDTAKFTYNPNPKDYLLVMGSIGRHKNQGAAIKIAKKLGMSLILAGKIRDKDYFEELKKDIDGEKIQWLGEISFNEKLSLYQNAKALLFPILWEEPFGLVMIEAMACGTPVIAFRHGAVPEVVAHGKTGFIIDNEDEMIRAIKKISKIDRSICRKHVEENFTVEKMIDSLEKALNKL